MYMFGSVFMHQGNQGFGPDVIINAGAEAAAVGGNIGFFGTGGAARPLSIVNNAHPRLFARNNLNTNAAPIPMYNFYRVDITEGGEGYDVSPSIAKAGETVSISAGTAPAGQIFVNWTSDNEGVVFANAASPSTTFTMVTGQVTVTAHWMPEGVIMAVFSLHAFNNGVINNQSLANAGLIRIWTRLDGVSTPVPSSLTVTAIDQDGNNAMEFVRVNEMWENPGYVNLIDVNFNAPWRRIYLTATVLGQTVEIVLINPRPPVVPEFSLFAFNNEVINNQSLADAGLIRIWTRLDGVSALVPNSLTATAIDQDDQCAMEFVRINQPWTNPGYVNSIDVNFNAPWHRIYLTATVFGQTVELVLINPRPPVVPEFSLNVFNNGVINNQSLANAGLIRLWTRLDGVGANVLITEITAVDQDGNNAMEHLRRINTVGVSPQNGFDVNFNAPWQQIYLTVTAYGQTLELTLVNPV